jgi:mono/diheme cytochrome c family protein
MLIVIRVAIVFGCVLLAAVSPPLRAQTNPATTLPDGAGKALVTAQCVGCHTLDVSLSRRATAEEWRGIVQTMVVRGAAINDQDAATIAGYLGQHFGPGRAGAGSAAAGELTLPEGRGRDVVVKRCFQCHQMTMWSALRQDRREWLAVMYRMVGRGALWSEDEIASMADYLAQIRGPQK